jgi:hypothetical protein
LPLLRGRGTLKTLTNTEKAIFAKQCRQVNKLQRARTASPPPLPSDEEAVPSDYEDEISFMSDIEHQDDLESHINMSNIESAERGIFKLCMLCRAFPAYFRPGGQAYGRRKVLMMVLYFYFLCF